MRKQLVVFDLDGTLVDTLVDVGICFNQSLSENGFPQHDLARYKDFVGGNLETVVSRMLPIDARTDANIDAVKTRYRELYQTSGKPNTKPFAGIPELVSSLAAHDVHMAVNSNKGQDLAEASLVAHFPSYAFPLIGYTEDFPPKPSPDGVFKFMEDFGATPGQTVYIGDATTDILTAQNAGVDCILVTWGQHSEADLAHPAVTAIAETPDAVLDLVLNRL